MDIPHFVYQFICQWTFGFLPRLANVNNTVININVQNSQDPIFNYFRYIARSGIVGSCGNFIFNFLQNLHNIFQTVAISFYIPTNRAQGLQSFHIFVSTCYFLFFFFFFLSSHSHGCDIVSYCSFDLYFPRSSVGKESTSCAGVHPQCRRPGFDPYIGKIPWRRKWQPTLVFLPRKSHGQRSLAHYSPWGGKSCT